MHRIFVAIATLGLLGAPASKLTAQPPRTFVARTYTLHSIDGRTLPTYSPDEAVSTADGVTTRSKTIIVSSFLAFKLDHSYGMRILGYMDVRPVPLPLDMRLVGTYEIRGATTLNLLTLAMPELNSLQTPAAAAVGGANGRPLQVFRLSGDSAIYIGNGPDNDARWVFLAGGGAVIEGPPCTCMHAEDEVGPTSVYTARSPETGGTFGTFRVTPVGGTGTMPVILINQGGASPRLELRGAKSTRSVTLAITYTKGGESTEVPPVTISFCAIDSTAFDAGAHDVTFDRASVGRAQVRVASNAWLNGVLASTSLQWQLPDIPGRTTREPLTGHGARPILSYRQLPEENDAFGDKLLAVTLVKDQCRCARDTPMRLFFDPHAANHPTSAVSATQLLGPRVDDRRVVQNWFYYWLQTVAGQSHRLFVRYMSQAQRTALEGASEYPHVFGAYYGTQFPLEVQVVYLSPKVVTESYQNPLTGVVAKAIDLFAIAIIHEWQHRENYFNWWAKVRANASEEASFQVALFAQDRDEGKGDHVPDSLELSMSPPLDPKKRATHGVPDGELFSIIAEGGWTLGKADKEDWSCGGRQWKGKLCK